MQVNLYTLTVVLAIGYSLLAVAVLGLVWYVFRLAEAVNDMNWNLIRNDVSPRFDAVMKLVYAIKVDICHDIEQANQARKDDYARLTTAFRVLTDFAGEAKTEREQTAIELQTIRHLTQAQLTAAEGAYSTMLDLTKVLREELLTAKTSKPGGVSYLSPQTMHDIQHRKKSNGGFE